MSAVPEAAAERPWILTLDVGTSSARALFFDRRGRRVEGHEGRRAYAPRVSAAGGADLDADELLADVEAALDDALAVPPPRGALGAVAVTTFWHSVLGVGEDRRALTPVYTWADTRSPFAPELRARIDEKAAHARTGCVFHPSYLPAKILWFARTMPETAGRVRRWMSFGEYVALRFLGRAAASVSMASGTGLFDQDADRWDEEILRAIGVPADKLSPVVDVGDLLGTLRDPWASRWPALAEVPWTAAVGDGVCNNLGSGCTTPERMAVMVGTSGAMRVCGRGPRPPALAGLFRYRASRERWVVGGALSEGGNVVDWLRRSLRLEDPAEVERAVDALPADGHGLTFLPFLGGERSPGWDSEARGVLEGVRLDTSPIEIFRAALEGIACRFGILRRLLKRVVPEAAEVVASGGALLRSPCWMQILADVLGCPVRASGEPEGSSRGAALLALEALGFISRIEEIPSAFGPRFDPDPARHGRYLEAIERQECAYRRWRQAPCPPEPESATGARLRDGGTR